MFSAVLGTELALLSLRVRVCPLGMELVSGQVTCEQEGKRLANLDRGSGGTYLGKDGR